jgi:Cys-rich repeat protein
MEPRTRLFCCTFIFALTCAACGSSGSTGGGGSGGTSSSSATTTSTTTTSTTATSTGTSSGCDPTTCPQTGTTCVTPSCGPGGTCTTTNAPAETACTDHGGTVCDGNGNCVACAQASDCPKPATACVTPTCAAGVCGTTNSPEGTVCNDAGGKVCDGDGHCVQCLTSADCTAGATCDTTTDTCTTPTCTDGIKDGQETDVDCGGPVCDAQDRTCANGKMCLVGPDCQSKVCTGDVCQVPTCTDGEQNGMETDVDCGGPLCDSTGHQCPVGDKCLIADDCVSLLCDAMNLCPAPSCMDGVKNGGETGIDCGNTAVTGCPPCIVGQGCVAESDCQSMHCVAGICAAASCTDGIQDGGESDVDCGHVCLKLCPTGKKCVVNGDCASGVCLATNLCM